MVIKKLLYQASKTKGVLKLMKNDILMITHKASISIRQNVAKIDFYQALPIMDKDGADEQREFRKVSHRLVLLYQASKTKGVLKLMKNDILMITHNDAKASYKTIKSSHPRYSKY
jgi:hypothetical protein